MPLESPGPQGTRGRECPVAARFPPCPVRSVPDVRPTLGLPPTLPAGSERRKIRGGRRRCRGTAVRRAITRSLLAGIGDAANQFAKGGLPPQNGDHDPPTRLTGLTVVHHVSSLRGFAPKAGEPCSKQQPRVLVFHRQPRRVPAWVEQEGCLAVEGRVASSPRCATELLKPNNVNSDQNAFAFAHKVSQLQPTIYPDVLALRRTTALRD